MIKTAVILAAGAGSRLGEISRHSSKAMVLLRGRPLIDWVVERLRRAGLVRIIVVAHTNDFALQAHSCNIGTEVACQHDRRGIADALCCAGPLLSRDEAFLACACDSLFRVDDLQRLLALGTKHPSDAVVAVQEVDPEATVTRSAVLCEGEVVRTIVEKPGRGTLQSNLVGLPLYLFPHRLLVRAAETLPIGGERYLSTTLNNEIQTGGRVRWVAFSERLEVTTPEDVERVEAILTEQAKTKG